MKALQRVHSYLESQSYSWDVLIVLDGPTDESHSKIDAFSRGRDNIRLISRRENKGKGFTVREGMLAARGRLRLFTDADNSTDISHFEKMKPLLDTGYDVVICSRDSKDAAGVIQAIKQPDHNFPVRRKSPAYGDRSADWCNRDLFV